MPACVADTSALMAFLLDEPGGDAAGAWLAWGAAVSALNLKELVSNVMRDGGAAEDAVATVADMALEAQHDLTSALALEAGAMVARTRVHGLSHGDRVWAAVADNLGVRIELTW